MAFISMYLLPTSLPNRFQKFSPNKYHVQVAGSVKALAICLPGSGQEVHNWNFKESAM